MAKHPHRLLLQQRKTWRCTLEGCAFFVHLGLAHVLIGKNAICWDCNEIFTIDAHSLKEEMPRCSSCRGGVSEIEQNLKEMEKRVALARQVKMDESNMTPYERLLKRAKENEQEKDEIEVIEADEEHSSECATYNGEECNCK